MPNFRAQFSCLSHYYYHDMTFSIFAFRVNIFKEMLHTPTWASPTTISPLGEPGALTHTRFPRRRFTQNRARTLRYLYKNIMTLHQGTTFGPYSQRSPYQEKYYCNNYCCILFNFLFLRNDFLQHLH